MSIADKLTQIAENEQKVFDAGKKAEYDRFWDVFQQNGERTAYISAFCGFRNTETFYPKYDIVPTGNAYGMMAYLGSSNNEPIDLAARLEECGVKLDTSKATSLQQAFYRRLGISRLPAISVESATNTADAISDNPRLVTVDKIIFSNDGTQPVHDNVLASNVNLQNITVEGVIGKNLNLLNTYSLSAESLRSIISHLKNYAGTDSEHTYKLTFAEQCWTRLEADSTAPDGGTWRDYVTYTLRWNT